MPFDDRQTGDLIDKLIKDDGVKAELTRNLNEGYLNKHGEFASNPMLLTFSIMNYPSYQSFYDRPHEFYRSAYDTIFRTTIWKKALRQGISECRQSG